jgi:hypothetical protein
MRRSLAPSQKATANFNQTPTYKASTPKNLVPASSNIPFEKAKKFNVVYGNVSGRKHKIYDSDGTLEIKGKKVVLKDCDGKVRDCYN